MSTGMYQNRIAAEIGAAESIPAKPRFLSTNPHGGRRLSVSNRMSGEISQSFGLDANEIIFRESSDAQRMGMRAYAQGNTINFAPGEFRPETREGREVLGHELHHIREQAGGDLSPNVYGSNILYDSSREAAGDRAGRDFASGNLSAPGEVSLEGASAEGAPVQGIVTAALLLTLLGALGIGGLLAGGSIAAENGRRKQGFKEDMDHQYNKYKRTENDKAFNHYGSVAEKGITDEIRPEIDANDSVDDEWLNEDSDAQKARKAERARKREKAKKGSWLTNLFR